MKPYKATWTKTDVNVWCNNQLIKYVNSVTKIHIRDDLGVADTPTTIANTSCIFLGRIQVISEHNLGKEIRHQSSLSINLIV